MMLNKPWHLLIINTTAFAEMIYPAFASGMRREGRAETRRIERPPFSIGCERLFTPQMVKLMMTMMTHLGDDEIEHPVVIDLA
jgi:hypothetical protein